MMIIKHSSNELYISLNKGVSSVQYIFPYLQSYTINFIIRISYILHIIKDRTHLTTGISDTSTAQTTHDMESTSTTTGPTVRADGPTATGAPFPREGNFPAGAGKLPARLPLSGVFHIPPPRILHPRQMHQTSEYAIVYLKLQISLVMFLYRLTNELSCLMIKYLCISKAPDNYFNFFFRVKGPLHDQY